MRTELFFFSGTGNSLYVAQQLAATMDAKRTPLASVNRTQTVHLDADAIGIVFPVYYDGLPVVVKEFAQALQIGGTYMFAVCTYGGSAGTSLIELDEILRNRGMALSAAYAVHMPQNAFKKFWEAQERIISRAKKKAEAIAATIKAGGTDTRCLRGFRRRIAEFVHRGLHQTTVNWFAKKLGTSEKLPLDNLIRMADRSFSASERCTGCGTCAKVCPVRNIELIEKKPIWQGRCESCLACRNWCPHQAIRGGVGQDSFVYRNRFIDLRDMIARDQ